MKKILLLILFIQLANVSISRVILTTVEYKSKTYYVDLVTNKNKSVSVWLRTSKTSCTPQDLRIFTISVSQKKYTEAKKLICRGVTIIDNVETISGCTAIVASGACAYVTARSGSAQTAAYCSAVWQYSTRQAMGACINGVSSKVADYLGKTIWADFSAQMGLSRAKLSHVANQTIQNVCRDAN